ncbi:NDR1/HIN1-like protein 13 [Rutidosis leptorrhynchoides]|uniref:NDR1/HIN1-like protein 13 n=1 Tax=Rutidosis leptorrhynchoides TaxID=125765 RepID=UPI003A990227
MAEKIYPASKPSAGPTPAAGNPSFPAGKAQLYNHTRPVYRPQPRRSRRSCCCSLCLWLTCILIILILLVALASGVVYVLYRPHRPTFAVASLHVTQFNLTSSNKLTTNFNFTISARNPNKKITFDYDPVSVSFNSNGVDVGDGKITAFTMPKKNTTMLRTVTSVNGVSVDDNSQLKSDLKSKKSLQLKIQLDTKVKVKIGSIKTKRLPIRVTCDGIRAPLPTGKTATMATVSDAKCKVDLRIKIWKWTI